LAAAAETLAAAAPQVTGNGLSYKSRFILH
jgi:hypothetical protein